MRVLIATDHYPPMVGGIERHVELLAATLATRHDVTVAAPHVKDAPPPPRTSAVKVARITGWSNALRVAYVDPNRPFHPPVPDPGVVVALTRVARRERVDVIHAHGWMLYSALAVRRRLGIPLIATLHDFSLVCAKQTYLRDGLMCRGPSPVRCLTCSAGHYGAVKGLAIAGGLRVATPIHSWCDRYVAVSRAVARASRASAGRRPVDVVPGFIADADFGRRQPRPDFVPRKPYALFVGTLGREKGIHVLLDAHLRLEGSIPLVLAGPRRPDTPNGAGPAVTILPPLSHDQVMAACQYARVVVMPSVAPEGFGLVAVEAMASGVPVIATRNAGLLDIVVDGETGLLVSPGDSVKLAQAIQRLWQDDGLRREMGAAAANRAERFRASAVVRRIEAIYGELR